jgi:hypothetical protein
MRQGPPKGNRDIFVSYVRAIAGVAIAFIVVFLVVFVPTVVLRAPSPNDVGYYTALSAVGSVTVLFIGFVATSAAVAVSVLDRRVYFSWKRNKLFYEHVNAFVDREECVLLCQSRSHTERPYVFGGLSSGVALSRIQVSVALFPRSHGFVSQLHQFLNQYQDDSSIRSQLNFVEGGSTFHEWEETFVRKIKKVAKNVTEFYTTFFDDGMFNVEQCSRFPSFLTILRMFNPPKQECAPDLELFVFCLWALLLRGTPNQVSHNGKRLLRVLQKFGTLTLVDDDVISFLLNKHHSDQDVRDKFFEILERCQQTTERRNSNLDRDKSEDDLLE